MIGTIFDCDGTLVDSMGAWHEVDRTLAAEAGITLTEADAEAAAKTPLLYGGSVKPDNAHELFSQPDIDGGLIGGAALKAEDFHSVCAAARVD